FGMFTHLSFAHAATTAIYTLSLHDALPIFAEHVGRQDVPTILAGDFNVKEDAELALLEETILTKAASAATFPSWKPTKALDHLLDRKSTRLNSSHVKISYAVFCLKKKTKKT